MVIEKKYYKVDSKELVDLLIQHINEKEIIAYDTETDSLNPRKGKIMASLFPVKKEWAFICRPCSGVTRLILWKNVRLKALAVNE